MKLTLIARIHTATIPEQLSEIADQAWPSVFERVKHFEAEVEKNYGIKIQDILEGNKVPRDSKNPFSGPPVGFISIQDVIFEILEGLANEVFGKNAEFLNMIGYLDGDEENNYDIFWNYFIKKKLLNYFFKERLHREIPNIHLELLESYLQDRLED